MDRSELLVSSKSDNTCNEANETCSFCLVGHIFDRYIFFSFQIRNENMTEQYSVGDTLLFNALSEPNPMKQEIELTYKISLFENSPRARRLWLKKDWAKKVDSNQMRIGKERF